MAVRYLEPALNEHLATLRQMVFITGPRQCGKTTLAKQLLGEVLPKWNYFNWDLVDHRKFLLKDVFPGKFGLAQAKQERICFDEIHKFTRWKNSLKGLFDSNEPEHSHWIVTGSALLNVFKKGQDSLLGRHFTYHLFPFSVAECCRQLRTAPPPFKDIIEMEFSPPRAEQAEYQNLLFNLTGFPEPLFNGRMGFLPRWRNTRLERLIQQDLAQTEQIKNLPLIENLMALLPERIGNPISINSLREDLEIHFTTVKHWIDLLKRIFYVFGIKPYSRKLPKLTKKAEKLYLWDWSEIDDPGVRFENFVAQHLQKYIYFCNEQGLEKLSLFYLKDRDQREVDFLICSNKKPSIAIECKVSDQTPPKQLVYFAKTLAIPKCILLVKEAREPKIITHDGVKIHIIPAPSFLGQLV